MSKALFALPFLSLALIAAAPAAPPVAPKPSIDAPAEIAADPANRLNLELSSGGTVVIQLRPDAAPNHVRRIQTPGRPGLLQRHRLPPRHPRLHGPGRRPERERRGRLQASRPCRRVQRLAACARSDVDGAHRGPEQRQQPVLHHPVADLHARPQIYRVWPSPVRACSSSTASRRASRRPSRPRSSGPGLTGRRRRSRPRRPRPPLPRPLRFRRRRPRFRQPRPRFRRPRPRPRPPTPESPADGG